MYTSISGPYIPAEVEPHPQTVYGRPDFIFGRLFRVEFGLKHLISLHSHFSLYSALLGFLLLLATVKLKSGFSIEHFGVWIFLSKVILFFFNVVKLTDNIHLNTCTQ